MGEVTFNSQVTGSPDLSGQAISKVLFISKGHITHGQDDSRNNKKMSSHI